MGSFALLPTSKELSVHVVRLPHVVSSQAQLFVLAHFKTLRWPPAAAQEVVDSSQLRPCCRTHFNIGRWPLAAAAAHTWVFHGHPFDLAHCERSSAPSDAAITANCCEALNSGRTEARHCLQTSRLKNRLVPEVKARMIAPISTGRECHPTIAFSSISIWLVQELAKMHEDRKLCTFDADGRVSSWSATDVIGEIRLEE